MGRHLVLLTVCIAIGCASAERVVPPSVTLPDDAAVTPYAELYPKLRNLAWKGTEAFYQDDWKELSVTAETLARAAKLLKASRDTPNRLRSDLAGRCDQLTSACMQLRDAAQSPVPDAISGKLQQIHNLIRELRPDPISSTP